MKVTFDLAASDDLDRLKIGKARARNSKPLACVPLQA
jgi:hypothetical protein